MNRVVLAAVTAASIGTATPARAQDAYLRCDGSPAPLAGIPNLQPIEDFGSREPRRGGLTGLIYGKGGTEKPGTGKFKVQFGAAGIAACNSALADPLIAELSSRRAQLLLAKALHLFANGEMSVAFDSLKEADTARGVGGNPFFQESMGAAISLTRAYFLIKSEKSPEATEILDSLAADRPYSATLADTIVRLRLIDGGNLERQIALRRATAPVDPEQMMILSGYAALDGHWDTIIEFDQYIDLVSPPPRPGWSWTEGDVREGLNQAMFGGIAAYALAASGQKQAAELRLQETERRLELYKQAVKRKLNPSDIWRVRQATYENAVAEVVKWRKAIALREAAPMLGFEAVGMRIRNETPSSFPFQVDLALRAAGDNPVAPEVVARVKKSLDERLAQDRLLGIDQFFELLPQRALPRAPIAVRNARGFIKEHDGGFTTETDKYGAMVVRFSHAQLSKEAVEEMAMLTAARLALKAGKPGILILSQQTIGRLVDNCLGYLTCSKYQTGYDAQMRVVFLDPSALPAERAKDRWRVLDARSIEAQITSRYRQAIQ